MSLHERMTLGPVLAEAEKVFGSKALTVIPATAGETPHQKVFRLVGEKKFEAAAMAAKRLIDAGDVEGFFIYGTGQSYRRASGMIADKVRASQKGAFAEITAVTPEVAQALLSANPKNRKIVAKGLAHRIRDIVGGRWELNGQPVIVARNGDLNDGQHRLWAVILSGKEVRSSVFFGAERDTRLSLDNGEIRQMASRLGFLDVPYAALAGAVVTLLHKIEAGRDATAQEKVALYLANEGAIQSAIRSVGGQPRGAPKSSLVVAAYLLLRGGAPAGLVEDFFSEVRGSSKAVSQKGASVALREAILKGIFRGPTDHLAFTVLFLYGAWRRRSRRSNFEIIISMPELVTH